MPRIALIPGDGIGSETVAAAVTVLDHVAATHGFELEFESFPWGCAHYHQTGRMMDEDGLQRLTAFDAILLGSVGDPTVPDHVSLWGLLIPIRRTFAQYVNLRPIRLLPGIAGPLRDATRVDLIVVRENNEGEYSEIGGRLYHGTEDEVALQVAAFTRRGTERIVRYAFDAARTRRGRLASATKSNGIVHTMPFWDEVFRAVGLEYPDVEASEFHADALAAYLVLDPERFDVIVASNLFGDILSDIGAAVAGSIGIAPSANLNPERRFPSMFEPVHGSAPDIAGRGIANPIGQIWSAAMMLEWLELPAAAASLLAAIETVVARGDVLTPDLGGTADTAAVTRAIVEAVS